jgi:hypothetical protein
MPSVMTTDIAPWFSMNSNISWATLGSARMSPVSTFQSRNGSASAFSEVTMPTATFRCLAEIRTVERNRRDRPAPVSLSSFLAQAFNKTIVHHCMIPSTLKIIAPVEA